VRNHVEKLKKWAGRLKMEVYALYLAYRDPRVPLYARVFAACVVGYAFSPIDLIPDPIPVLGYLDDLILAECREKARQASRESRPVNRVSAVAVVAVWLALAALAIYLTIRFL
jgi:uncharacterized membrane protein YkvA (DUF1232 family)